jgi:hypothetical protein
MTDWFLRLSGFTQFYLLFYAGIVLMVWAPFTVRVGK